MKKNEGLFEQEVGEELIIQNVKSGEIHMLNGTAAYVWGVLDGKNENEICDLVAKKFIGANEETIQNDVKEILKLFLDKELVCL